MLQQTLSLELGDCHFLCRENFPLINLTVYVCFIFPAVIFPYLPKKTFFSELQLFYK